MDLTEEWWGQRNKKERWGETCAVQPGGIMPPIQPCREASLAVTAWREYYRGQGSWGEPYNAVASHCPLGTHAEAPSADTELGAQSATGN